MARTPTGHPRARPGRTGQLPAAFRAAWRDARRNPAQWALFAVVPVVFILTAEAVTPNQPIAVASRSALVGLFVLLDSTDADRRTALAGLRPATLLTARLGVLALTALAATAVSLAATALVFDAARWPRRCDGARHVGLRTNF